MGKIIGITAILLVGLFSTTIAQTQNPNFKKDFKEEIPNKDNLKSGPNPFFPGDTMSIFIPDLEGKLNFPDLNRQHASLNPENGALVDSNLPNIYRMPILTAQGNHPMPIYQPDSTINYTLRIKDFK
ncbi:hypothetical protein [Cecembia sp.]|uniref:hypothetical protein n=1 Tax=Cecembia sp. TaxID=1898110 RepID=UPI0025BEE55C|nr:hypothetical protein [Cecembia sp.]